MRDNDPNEGQYQKLSSFTVPEGFRGRSGAYVAIWWFIQATVFRWSPQPLYAFRAALLRMFGARVGIGVKIRQSARFTYPWKIEVGDNVWIGDRAELYSLEHIVIEKDVCISQGAYICTGSHDYRDVQFSYMCRSILIKEQSWIGADVFVCPGTTVGIGCVVTARSLVKGRLEKGFIYSGAPASIIRQR